MNQHEYTALSDSALPHSAVVLYIRGFRRYMNYSTGLVSLSLSRLAQELEYTPVWGSSDKPTKSTISQIRNLTKRLIAAGLISIHERGDINTRKPAVFSCCLAQTDLVRLKKERHDSDTKPTTRKVNENVSKNNVLRFSGDTTATQEERHRSVDPLDKIDESNARENLKFGSEWVDLANSVGLSTEHTEEMQAWFDSWKFGDQANTIRSLAQHKNQWRKYCAAIKANSFKPRGQGNESNQRYNPKQARSDATSDALDECFAAARRGEGQQTW
jgi:hypothetical protein